MKVEEWGKGIGEEDGQFQIAVDVSVHNNFVYVSDSENARFQIFTLDGKYVHQWGINRRFFAPFGITFFDNCLVSADIENGFLDFWR